MELESRGTGPWLSPMRESGRPPADSLHKIHAQSSAETSGLGDSLQRIHTLSSTETSADGGATPSPSREPSKRRASFELAVAEDHANNARVHGKMKGPTPSSPSKAAQDQDAEVARYMEHELDGGPYSPNQTPAGSRRGSVQFLGKHTNSTWLNWSRQRHESFKKRLDSIEQKQQDAVKNRVPTPVRKARKESVMFVSPELEKDHLPKDEMEHIHKKLEKFVPAPRISRRQRLEGKGKGEVGATFYPYDRADYSYYRTHV